MMGEHRIEDFAIRCAREPVNDLVQPQHMDQLIGEMLGGVVVLKEPCQLIDVANWRSIWVHASAKSAIGFANIMQKRYSREAGAGSIIQL